jgi:hypothetical protein
VLPGRDASEFDPFEHARTKLVPHPTAILTAHRKSTRDLRYRRSGWVVEQRKPLIAGFGHRATGPYAVVSNPHEVVMVSATDIPSRVRLRQDRDTPRGLCDEGEVDDRIVARGRLSARFVTGGDSHVMRPLPRTAYGPGDWEDAALEDWLEPGKNDGA